MSTSIDRIGKYLNSRRKFPMKQLGDGLHAIQVGSEWEAELTLSDLNELHASYASLVEENKRLREALGVANVALVDWLNIYASDMCALDRVREAQDRVAGEGGTIAYIAKVTAQIRETLGDANA